MEDVALAKTGHRDAFARLVARHQNQMCGVALAIVRDVALSEDVAQEAFVRAWRARQKQSTLRESLPESAAPPTDAAAERAQQCAFVNAALADLADADREILIAQLREDLSLRELAARFAVSEAVAQKRLSRARQRLQERTEARLTKGLKKTAPAATFAIAVLAGLDVEAAPLALRLARPKWIWGAGAAATVMIVAFLGRTPAEHAPVQTRQTAASLATSHEPSDDARSANLCLSARAGAPPTLRGFNDDDAGISQARAAWQSNPEAVFERAFEIATYDRRHQTAPADEAKTIELAMIEHCANAPEFIDMRLGSTLDPDVVSAWEAELAQAQNTLPLRRAARYFVFADNPRAQALLRQALRYVPKDPYLKLDLVEAAALARPSDKEARQKAMLALSNEIGDRTVMILGLERLAFEALDAGEWQEATQCADEMVAFTKTRDLSFSLHRNNLVYGEVALRQNDLASARKYLLAEGDASPSAGFAVDFPPLTELADKLLAREHQPKPVATTHRALPMVGLALIGFA